MIDRFRTIAGKPGGILIGGGHNILEKLVVRVLLTVFYFLILN